MNAQIYAKIDNSWLEKYRDELKKNILTYNFIVIFFC